MNNNLGMNPESWLINTIEPGGYLSIYIIFWHTKAVSKFPNAEYPI